METLPEKNDGENAQDDWRSELKLCVHELWLFFKYWILYPVIAIVALLLLLNAVFWAYYYLFFVWVHEIPVCRAGGMPVEMSVPVRWCGGVFPRHRQGAMELLAPSGWRYWVSFDRDKPEQIFIFRHWDSLFFGGHVASYEITDPAAVAKLTPIFRQCRERRLREIAAEEQEKNKSHEREK